MQPNQANETKLPRAVLRRSAAIAEKYKPREPDPANPAAEAAPAPGPAATPATPAEPAAPAVDPRESDPAYWKQRFSVTSGLLTRERTENQTQVRALNQRIAELEAEASRIQATTPSEIDLTQIFTPEQIEKFGEEQCRVMAKAAATTARTEAQKLIDAAVQPLKSSRDQDQAETNRRRQQEMRDQITEVYPAWTVDDKDPRWLAWLAEIDETTQTERQATLNAHITAGNGTAIGNMFRVWSKTIAPAPTPPAPTPPAPPVTPSGSGASATVDIPPASNAQVDGLKPLTPGETKAFYTRAAINKVTDAERKVFEARLALTHPTARA